MKMSEAIRLGSMMKPQAFGNYYSVDGGSCAMGAAYDAIGVHANSGNKPAEWIRFTYHKCPHVGCPMALNDVVVHLNDIHRWTREAIADYIEGEEKSMAVEVEVELVQGVI